MNNAQLTINNQELGIKNQELGFENGRAIDSELVERAKQESIKEWEKLEKPDELKGIRAYTDLKLDSTVKQRVVSEMKNEAVSEFNKLEKPRELAGLPSVKGIKLDSTYKDSASVAKMRKQLINRGEQELRNTKVFGELDENKSAALKSKENFFQTPNEISMKDGRLDSAAIKQQAMEKAKTQLTQIAQQAGALNQVNKLKGKYGKVLNSNDLSTAVKRNSLEGQPFGQRLVLGGDFNILDTDPFIADLAGSVGYKFTKRLLSGIQGSYRVGRMDSSSVRGGRVFTNYDLARNFYAAGEFEMMSRSVNIENGSERDWHPGFFLGVGRTFALLPKLKAQVALMYNFLYENQDGIYNRPFVVRFGFSSQGLFKK